MSFVKTCGITTAHDARHAVESGADAIGVNVWPKRPRAGSIEQARDICGAVRGRPRLVGVTVDLERVAIEALREKLRPDWVQLHGDEPAELVAALAPRAYKAVGLATYE